ncbi:MAG: molybdenum cofactor cytidylyltransferase [Thermotogota bacterium]|nr:molybdenum cofactor cytidylyltransferase [Thermotogota bacterium]MDK2864956.1 molybdenum cofactor cytidylyltransferase [Thermotogota bacterium]
MNLCVAILAAGKSERFGSHKLVADFNGKPMLQWIIDNVAPLDARRKIIIVNPLWKEIRDRFTLFDLEVVYNLNYEEGIASSVRAAVSAGAAENCDTVMFLLGDMPLVKTEVIKKVIEEAQNSEKPIVSAYFHDTKGFPTVVKSPAFPYILSLRGDEGIKQLIKNRPELLHRVPIEDPDIVKDMDYNG